MQDIICAPSQNSSSCDAMSFQESEELDVDIVGKKEFLRFAVLKK